MSSHVFFFLYVLFIYSLSVLIRIKCILSVHTVGHVVLDWKFGNIILHRDRAGAQWHTTLCCVLFGWICPNQGRNQWGLNGSDLTAVNTLFDNDVAKNNTTMAITITFAMAKHLQRQLDANVKHIIFYICSFILPTNRLAPLWITDSYAVHDHIVSVHCLIHKKCIFCMYVSHAAERLCTIRNQNEFNFFLNIRSTKTVFSQTNTP